MSDDAPTEERLRRWRLVLGGEDADGTGHQLHGEDLRRDEALAQLYDADPGADRRGGLSASSPRVARWLGDIRTYFPSSVVQVLQHDAMDRLGLRQLLLEPEMLATVQPDVALVGTLMGLGRAIPEHSRETARGVVRQVVRDLELRLAGATRQAVTGALDRANRTRRPRPADIDWHRTIAANLVRYQPEHRTIIPERLVGRGRRSQQIQREVVLCVDQSGSMASSVVYASVFAAVLASLRAIRTRIVVFDTAVVDLPDQVDDPVDVLFGVQLGGGTDIGGALGYCRRLITRPRDTVVVLVSDLFEGGDPTALRTRVAEMVRDGVRVLVLLALSDDGVPAHDHHEAEALAALGATVTSCTPDEFPEVLAGML